MLLVRCFFWKRSSASSFQQANTSNLLAWRSLSCHPDKWLLPLAHPLELLVTSSNNSNVNNNTKKEIKQRLQSWAHRLDKRYVLADQKRQQDSRRAHLRNARALQTRLARLLSLRFRKTNVRVYLYGSCVSGLGQQETSDVDISVEIPQKQKPVVNDARQRRKLLFNIRDCLQRQTDFHDVVAVNKKNIRIPLVLGKWEIPVQQSTTACQTKKKPKLSPSSSSPLTRPRQVIDFDITLADAYLPRVPNSLLLKEYGKIDVRVGALVAIVKQWAQNNQIATAKYGGLSTYAWSILAIFYLQHVGVVPKLQCRELAPQACRHTYEKNQQSQPFDTFFWTWKQIKSTWIRNNEEESSRSPQNLPVTLLFYGFVRFYTRDYPADRLVISIAANNPQSHRKEGSFWSIEDPFETFDSSRPRDLNTCTEKGFFSILKAMHETELHVAALLLEGLSKEENEEARNLPSRLWLPLDRDDDDN